MTNEPMNRRDFLTASGLSAGALLILPASARAQGLTRDEVFRDPDQPVLGNPDGDVTIAEFFDYQCPYCKKGHPAVDRVVKKDGNVRLVMKDWPIFGATSVRASQLVLGATALGQYEQAQNALMATKARLTDAQVTQALTDAGVDVAKADAAYREDRSRWDGLMSRNDEQAMALGLQGTPAFVIGTAYYPGLIDEKTLKEAIARARS